MAQTMDKLDAFSAKILVPGRICTKIKSLDYTSSSSNKLKAEGGADKSMATRHHKAVIFNPFVFAKMHFQVYHSHQTTRLRCSLRSPVSGLRQRRSTTMHFPIKWFKQRLTTNFVFLPSI